MGVRRSRVGDIAYFVINAALPVVLLLLVRNFDSAYPALALVILSKWRVFALRPRFWWPNFKANLVDLLVGVSIVTLMFFALNSQGMQIILVFGYAAWLLYLKPKSNTRAILFQAGIAQFLSLTVLFSLSTYMAEPLVVLGCWIIGYVVARHVVSIHDEEHIELISSFWGLFLAELGWLSFHWTISYDNLGIPLRLPQISLLVAVISFAATRLYLASKTQRLSDSSLRVTITSSAILVIVILLFSHWGVTK